MNFGIALAQGRQWERAVAHFERALQRNPEREAHCRLDSRALADGVEQGWRQVGDALSALSASTELMHIPCQRAGRAQKNPLGKP